MLIVRGRQDHMTITEAGEKYGLTPDTLRYYERIGLIPPVNRKRGGVRDYTEEDCRWVEFAKCMRAAGLSIEVLLEYLALFERGDETIEKRKQLLIGQRDQLAARIEEMRGTLKRLDGKIQKYEEGWFTGKKRGSETAP
jgi:DNA-binding transcriptional MerR regulator